MFQATNNTDYLLLASKDVSIFFDNSFVTKTSLTSVSPGESFQTFLGIDPAVKVRRLKEQYYMYYEYTSKYMYNGYIRLRQVSVLCANWPKRLQCLCVQDEPWSYYLCVIIMHSPYLVA